MSRGMRVCLVYVGLFIAGIWWSVLIGGNGFLGYFLGFPWSFVSLSLVLFGLPVIYFFNTLALYRILNRGKTLQSEAKKMSMVVSGGYVVWAIPVIYESLTCSEPFCSLGGLMATSLSPVLLIEQQRPPGGFERIFWLALAVSLNFILMVVAFRKMAWSVDKKIKK